MPGHYADTSNITAGTQINANDVKVPIDALDDKLYALVTGTDPFTSIDINGGSIDGAAIGANSHSTGKFTSAEITGTMSVAGSATFSGTVSSNGALTVNGALTAASTLAVSNASEFNGAVDFNSTTNFDGIAAFNAAVDCNSTFNADGAATFTNTVTVSAASDDGLTISRASGSAGLNLTAAAGNYRSLRYETAGGLRWVLEANNTAESGSNAGSDFTLSRWDDSAGFLSLVWEITRSNGNFRIVNDVEFDGALNHDGSTVGFYGTTPTTRQSYTVSGTPLRTISAASTTANVRDVVIALVTDLKAVGLLA